MFSIRWLTAVAIAWALSACYPIQIAPECQLRMQKCLQGCDSAHSTSAIPSFEASDQRSHCVTRCHKMCTQLNPLK